MAMSGSNIRLRIQRQSKFRRSELTTRRFPRLHFRSTISGTMRAETDVAKLQAFMAELGNRVRGPRRIYPTALLRGWRATTIGVDLKPDPEPPGLFEALAALKDELDINVKLASPAFRELVHEMVEAELAVIDSRH